MAVKGDLRVANNRRFLLVRRPVGDPVPEDFRLVEEPVPAPPPGGFVMRNHYASLDPAQRGWMDDAPSYMPPIPLGDPVRATTIGTVHASDNPDFAVGAWVMGLNGLEDYSANGPGGFTSPVDVSALPSPTNCLYAFGAVGLTAYFGMEELAPKAGETLLVSGAAGAVGSVVGQIGKIRGCRVIGIAGGAEKCRRLTGDYGFDAAIDYRGKSGAELAAAIADAAPGGVNMIFENVGGEVLDAGLMNLASEARILICGLISEYNAKDKVGARNLWQLLVHRARMKGFLIADYVARFAEGGAEIGKWFAAGKLRCDEDVQDGLENFPAVYRRLFTGENTGKLILKIA
jgi:NADPH-dependent curcumin reductase CurA